MIISDGYNGTPHGFNNKCEIGDITKEEVIHAEANAILKLAKSPESSEGASMFTTYAPCFDCAKVLANSNVTRIVASVWYPQTEVKDILEQAHIIVDIPTLVNIERWDCQP